MFLFSEILGNDTKQLQHDCALATCYFAGTQEVIRCPQATSTYRQCEDWRPTPGSSIKDLDGFGRSQNFPPHWAPGRPRFLPPLDFCLCIFLREGNCTRNAKWRFYRQIVRYYQCIISRNRNEKLKRKWKCGTSNAVGGEVAKMLKGCEKVLLCSWSASKEKLRMIKTFWQRKGKGRQNVHKNPVTGAGDTKEKHESMLTPQVRQEPEVTKTLPTTGPPKRYRTMYLSRDKKPGTFGVWIPQLKRHPKDSVDEAVPPSPRKSWRPLHSTLRSAFLLVTLEPVKIVVGQLAAPLFCFWDSMQHRGL